MLNHTIDGLRMKLAATISRTRSAQIMLNFTEEFGDKARLGISNGLEVNEIVKLAVKAAHHANIALRCTAEIVEELDNDCIRVDEGDGVKLTHRA